MLSKAVYVGNTQHLKRQTAVVRASSKKDKLEAKFDSIELPENQSWIELPAQDFEPINVELDCPHCLREYPFHTPPHMSSKQAEVCGRRLGVNKAAAREDRDAAMKNLRNIYGWSSQKVGRAFNLTKNAVKHVFENK